MKIEFVSLRTQIKSRSREFLRALTEVIREGQFIDGNDVTTFESRFARYLGKRYCIGVNSGTDALFLALKAYDIGKGDEVITAPNSFFATAAAIEATGATVVFSDIDPITYTISPQEVAKKITSRTKALIPVHLYGQPADMDTLIKLAKKNKLTIIEDCCQAHGARYKGHSVPVTETGAFSFYPGKNLGAFGDAGAVVTDDTYIAHRVQLLRNHGSKSKYHHTLFGYNSRLDSLQAAILTTKLQYLTGWNKKRQQHAELYTKLLATIPYIKPPTIAPASFHVYHIYGVIAEDRNLLQKFLQSRHIDTLIHYPIPIHLQRPYQKLGYKKGDFPNTEWQAESILSLPMYPELKPQEIKYVVDSIEEFYQKYI